MAIVINTKSFGRDISPNGNSVPYLGPLNTLTLKDRLDLSRTPAKPTSVFSGIARVQAKLTRTLTLTGAKTATGDAIGTYLVNFPVGSSSTDQDTFLTDMAALAADASVKAFAKTHVLPT